MTTSDTINVFVALGTLALAAFAFWPIWGNYRNRPDLTLEVEEKPVHTRLEGRKPWIRLVVRNGRRRRTAHDARVLVHWCTPSNYDDVPVSLAGADLGWPSASLRAGEGAVIFGGMSRPLDFGVLGMGPLKRPRQFAAMMQEGDELQDGQQWWFRFTLAMNGSGLYIGREFLPPIPGGYTARVTVGADEGRAKEFDVKFSWVGGAPTPDVVLDTFAIAVSEAD